MEPRPQRPRPAQNGMPQPRGGDDGHTQQIPPQQGGEPHDDHTQAYPHGYDPGQVVAPPRTDYDYSPLDLAPPGQRRRRQIIAGVLGALSVVLLGALIVFGWMLLRDDSDDPIDNDDDRVAVLTGTPDDEANAPSTPEPTNPPTEEPAETEVPAAEPTTETATEEPDAGAADTSVEGITAQMPTVEMAPAGFVQDADTSQDLAAVVTALGGSRIAEQNLQEWGWTANVSRAFNNPDPQPGTTTYILVSAHGFDSPESAALALPFYSDILAEVGWTELENPQMGDLSRMLTSTDEEGNVQVSLYVQDGPIMYRFAGSASPGGDPTQDVLNMAAAMFGQ